MQQMPDTWVPSLGWEEPLEEGMVIHSIQYSCLENPMERGAWWSSPSDCKELDMTEVT